MKIGDVEVESVSVLQVNPGDTLIVRIPRAGSLDQINILKRTLQERFPEQRCLILSDGASIEVLKAAEGSLDFHNAILNGVVEAFRKNEKGCTGALAEMVAGRVINLTNKELSNGS